MDPAGRHRGSGHQADRVGAAEVDRATAAVRFAWAATAWHQPYRSVHEALGERQRAGQAPDEKYFEARPQLGRRGDFVLDDDRHE